MSMFHIYNSAQLFYKVLHTPYCWDREMHRPITVKCHVICASAWCGREIHSRQLVDRPDRFPRLPRLLNFKTASIDSFFEKLIRFPKLPRLPDFKTNPWLSYLWFNLCSLHMFKILWEVNRISTISKITGFQDGHVISCLCFHLQSLHTLMIH